MTLGSLDEDVEGRATVCCKNLLPPPSNLDMVLGLASFEEEDVAQVPEGAVAGMLAGMPM